MTLKYAFVNGNILDGTKDMQPVRGKAVLVEDGLVTGIVPESERPEG